MSNQPDRTNGDDLETRGLSITDDWTVTSVTMGEPDEPTADGDDHIIRGRD